MKKGYVNEYVSVKKIVVDDMAKKYTIPKLNIPKDTNGKPTVAKGKHWYVYYYFKNPITQKFNWNKPIKIKAGINRKKTVKERKAYGKMIIAELTELLKDGFCPYIDESYHEKSTKVYTVTEALDYAIEVKSNETKQNTIDGYKYRKNVFVNWLRSKSLHYTPINDINKNHIKAFLNHIAANSSNRNVNNYRVTLSTLFSKLVSEDIIDTNILKNIKNLKTTPKKHQTFSQSELEKLKAFLLKENPYLYKFMVFAAYSFMRPIEVCRLKVKNIDLENSLMHVETKTSANETILIIDKLKPIIESFNLEKYDKEFFLFTPLNNPGTWNTLKEKSRSSYFSKQFSRVRKKLDLDFNNTIYGLRHTFATDIYNGFIAQGLNERETILKMLPITRHKSEKSLRNYLRNVDAFITSDYSDKIKTDF